jgi:hypothetical protein
LSIALDRPRSWAAKEDGNEDKAAEDRAADELAVIDSRFVASFGLGFEIEALVRS